MTDVCINVAPATFTIKLMYPYIQIWINLPINVPTSTEAPANAIITLGAGLTQVKIKGEI